MPTWSKTPPLKLPRAEHYYLFDKIAAGGMASVHLGLLRGALGFSRVVAIKRLHPTLACDERRVAMMVDEARVAALVRHVNVVPTLDVIVFGGEVFVVMEYVRGASLSNLVSFERGRGGLLATDALVSIVRGTLRGLQAAHNATSFDGEALGIVHRDVSPQNILVGVGGIARLIDFGVARAEGSQDETRDGEFKGKLAYAAPEQLNGERITSQADIFAMGVVLWEALVGERLFAGESDLETYRNVVVGEIRDPLAVYDSDTPEGHRMRAHRKREDVVLLAEVAMRALAREPSARFPNAEAMEEAMAKLPGAPPGQVGTLVQLCAAERLAFEHSVVSSVIARSGELESEDSRSARVGPTRPAEQTPVTLILKSPEGDGGGEGSLAEPRADPRAPSPDSTARPWSGAAVALAAFAAAFLGALAGSRFFR